jgi:hypothetical protein
MSMTPLTPVVRTQVPSRNYSGYISSYTLIAQEKGMKYGRVGYEIGEEEKGNDAITDVEAPYEEDKTSDPEP